VAARPRVLSALAVLGCLLLPAGAVLVATSVGGGHDGRTILGILLALAGLVCWRILYWVRRVRAMTRAGLAFSTDEERGERPG
jgi:drug/metabolite transporter (DMT)-like permease